MSLTVDTECIATLSRSGTAAYPSLLLIDLGEVVRHDLAAYLEHNRFSLTTAASLDLLYEADWPGLNLFDAMVLVAQLPNPEVLSAIRRMSDGGPPLLVLARDADAMERVLALEMGADDLVGREAGWREVLTRLHRLMRRPSTTSTAALGSTEEAWALKQAQRALITPGGQSIKLSGRDQALMNAFATNTDGLLRECEEQRGQMRTAISRLKRRVLLDGGVAIPIETVWGQGYCFNAPLVQA